MENEDSLKIERLEDDGLQDVPILEAGYPRHPGGVPLLIR